jgi:hypothetical protein
VGENARTDLLESGVRFRADMGCYKRFISKFPECLKKWILDIHGNRIQKPCEKEGETSEQSTGTGSGIGSVGEAMDAGEEEGIGGHILTRTRMRITVKHAREDRHPNATTIATRVFLSTSCFVVFFYMSFGSQSRWALANSSTTSVSRAL